MSINTLYTLLEGQTTLVLNETGLGPEGANLIPLLSELSSSEITLENLGGPTWENPENTMFSLTGISRDPLLEIATAMVKLVAEEIGGEVQFQLRVETNSEWAFGTSFPQLSETSFQMLAFDSPPAFVLSTRPIPAANLEEGLNFTGRLKIEGVVGAVLDLVPLPPLPLDFVGQVQEIDDYRLVSFRVHLSEDNYDVAFLNWVTLQFASPDLALYAYLHPDSVMVERTIESAVSIEGGGSSSQPIPLALQLPTMDTNWQVRLQPGQTPSIGNLLDFLTLLGTGGNSDLRSILMDPTGTLNRVEDALEMLRLEDLSIDISGTLGQSPEFQSFSFALQGEGEPWKLIPSVLEVRTPTLSLQVTRENGDFVHTGLVSGEVDLGDDLVLKTSISLPIGSGDWQFQSQDAIQLSSLDVLSHLTANNPIRTLLPGSLQVLEDLSLTRLDLLFDPLEADIGQLDFSIRSTDLWEIIPGELKMQSLALDLTMANAETGWGITGKVSGELQAGGVNLAAQANKSTPHSDWIFSIHADQVPLANLGDIRNLIGGKNALTEALPESLFNAALFLNEPHLEANLSERKLESFGFSLTTAEISLGSFQVSDAVVDVDIEYGESTTIDLAGGFELGDISFDLTGKYQNTGGWLITGEAGMQTPIAIGELLQHLATDFGIPATVPAVLAGLMLSNIKLSFNTETKDFRFSFTTIFPFGNKELQAIIHIDALHNDEMYTRNFSGVLQIDNLEFDLIFQQDNMAASIFLASYKNEAGGDLSIEPLVALVTDNTDILNAASGISFNLKDALLVMDRGGSSRLLFGLDIGGGLDLSRLPLLGSKLPNNESLRVTFQPLLTSHDFSEADLNAIRSLVPEGGYELPKEATERLALNMQLRIGEEKIGLNLPIGANDVKTQPASDMVPVATSSASGETSGAPPASTDGIHWYPINKQLGPVDFGRVGVQFKNGELTFLLDAALTANGLRIGLDGLYASSSLNPIEPMFGLHGLDIDYDNGPLEIGGAFLRQSFTDENGNSYDGYDGTAVIRTEEFSLAALGSYAAYEGHPSLFVYAFTDTPLGGPAFFFVTGVAAGFGYNRKVVLPGLNGISRFPLVAEAIAGVPGQTNDLSAELSMLHDVIPPAFGESFFAAGFRFTSFEIIDSFALLTISLERDFNVDVLGLSTLVIPTPEAGSTKEPLAEVQMALKAVFDPEKGYLKVRSALTSASYILSRKCHLTGGFAFYTWFKDDPSDNASAGDFVLTMGGYHPRYQVPAHYPKVPRLAFNWKVSSHIEIKGDMYFALVPSAVMAGGDLNANWHSGSLRAWFQLGADFIISWRPYFYDASLSVSMGVSYTFHFFGRHHISVSVGAGLHIWGPEFSGRAHVHLWIVSFTVTFGAHSPDNPRALDWDQFRNGFLPASSKWVSGIVTRGLIRQNGSQSAPLYVVNPSDFRMEISSAVPITRSNQATGLHSINIGAMKITDDLINSGLDFFIYRGEEDVTDEFNFEPILKQVPSALWGKEFRHSVTEPTDGRLIDDICTGFAIVGKPPVPSAASHSIATGKLLTEVENFGTTVLWGNVQDLGMEWLGSEDVLDAITSGLESKHIARTNLLQSLGFDANFQPNQQLVTEFIISPNTNIPNSNA